MRNPHYKKKKNRQPIKTNINVNTNKEIARVLQLTKEQLNNATHHTDITKTCRSVTKLLYPDITQRAQMTISIMPINKLAAIRRNIKINLNSTK